METLKSLDKLVASVINLLVSFVQVLTSKQTWAVIGLIALFILGVCMMFNPFLPTPSGEFLIESPTISAVCSIGGFLVVCAYTSFEG